MKKLFGRTKNEKIDDDLQWDDLDDLEAEAEEEYYAEDGDEYYEAEAEEEYYAEDDEYYEAEVEEEYCAEDGDEEYYEAEAEEEYYAEDGDEYYEAEAEEEYYVEDGDEYYQADADEDIEEEDLDNDDEDIVVPWMAQKEDNIFRTLWLKLVHMETMDKVMVSTGILVLVLAIVTCSVFAGAERVNKEVASFSTVGEQLLSINLIGEHGLTAVADAELAKQEAADAIIQEEENKDYEENEYSKIVTVSLNMTSVEKDLKIKFVNDKTNKLIANVPFSVTIENPDGEEEIWTDDDMDGIIYKADIKPGNYKVTMNTLEDAKYEDYIIATYTERITVKKEIAYEKIEVADEIKDESEVNAKEEDTAAENEIEVESTLQDTVSWVESTKTVISSVYTAVPKTSVADPMATAKAGTLVRTSALISTSETGAVATPVPEATPTPTPEVTATPVPEITPTPTPQATPTPTPEVTATPEVTPTPTPEVEESPSPSPTPEIAVVTGITLDKLALELKEEETAQLKATVEPAEVTDAVLVWSSSDNTVVKVDNTGKVEALKEGTATITVLHEETGIKAECTITVKAAEDTRTLKLSEEKVLLPKSGSTKEITATIGNTVTGGKIDGVIVATSDNTSVVTVTVGTTKDGIAKLVLTPKGLGTAVITVSVEGAPELTKTCTVTVADLNMTLNTDKVSVLSGSSKELQAVINGTGGKVVVETANAGLATATVTTSESGGKTTAKVVVSGVSAGSVTITIKFTKDGLELKKTCTVTVVNSNNKLVSKDNKQLYVLVSDGNYREATYADYYNDAITTFYIKTEGVVKYTGWQTLDGKVYYYDASGKYVTGEQVIQGAKYTFASDGSLVVGSGTLGIDVSKWNTVTDWNAIKNSGVSYVIIRCGYRGSSTGALVVDPKFEEYIKGATAAGLKVGVYFFSQAVNNREAVEEASMVLELIDKYKITYPVYLDVEASGGRADNISVATRTDVIKTFCQTIQNAGYTAGVYANKNWLNTKIDTSQLGKYKIWLAQYAAEPTYSGRYDMWQYTDTGKVTGIKGNVDLNISYLGY